MFASPAMQKFGNVLLDILTVGFLRDFLMRPLRRRIAAASTPVDSLDPELVEMGTFVAERPPREEPVSELSPDAPPASEKMVVVDHQRGKTDIIVVQQTVVAASANGHAASEEVAVAPLVADLGEQSENGHAASLPDRREEHK
jgi:hypothetical protein